MSMKNYTGIVRNYAITRLYLFSLLKTLLNYYNNEQHRDASFSLPSAGITRNRISPRSKQHACIIWSLYSRNTRLNFEGNTLCSKFRLIVRGKLHPLPALMGASTCTSFARYSHAPHLDYYYEFTALSNSFVETRRSRTFPIYALYYYIIITYREYKFLISDWWK